MFVALKKKIKKHEFAMKLVQYP